MRKILSITLIRPKSMYEFFEENRIVSTLRINFTKKSRFCIYNIQILENRDYLIPAGVWEIKNESSPKFRTKLWEFKDLPYQKEVKLHIGTKHTDSKGCPIISASNLALLNSVLDQKNSYYVNIKET